MTDKPLEERRRDILAAAEACFESDGYAATTMEAVAEKAGISKGNIYNYFGSKRDLFTQLFAASMAATEADYDRLANEPISATEKLSHLVDHWFHRLGQHTRIGSLVLEFWAAAARHSERNEFSSWFSQTYDQWRKKMAAVVAEGVAHREFRQGIKPEVAASLILAILDGITVQRILDQSLSLDAEFLSAIKRAISTALMAQPAPQQEQQDVPG